MAYKTLIFGVDDIFDKLKPYYERAVQRGILEIVAFAVIEQDRIGFVSPDGNLTDDTLDIDLAIISSCDNFFERMKQLESMGVSRNRIIDGKIFYVAPDLDLPRLLAEGVVYSSELENPFFDNSYSVHPRVYANKVITVRFGTKTYVENASWHGYGEISAGNFSVMSTNILFELGINFDHNVRNVSLYSLTHLDWEFPDEFLPPFGNCKILIGNDVWIGRGSILKCTNPEQPLVIGDGAVIAAESVVVKNVPPYAIVGGNPAQIIKYRFPPHIIDALLRIKWWDWSIDKIHDNFKYFGDVEKFVTLHDT